MKSKILLIATHVFCCVAFLCLPYIFAPNGFPNVAVLVRNQHERTYLLSYVIMLGYFYLNYYIFIPRLFFQKKYVLYVLSAILAFGLVMFNVIRLDRQEIVERFFSSSEPPTMGNPPPPPPSSNNMFDRPPPPSNQMPMGRLQKPNYGFELSHGLFLFLVGVFVSLSIRISNRLLLIERQQVSTELSFLKAQINPHFLFNTLNTIYSLAIVKSDQTADAIVKLSALMRHVISDAHEQEVPLAKELEYIGHYIALQQLRLGDTVAVDFSQKVVPNGKMIAPLILISFIENAFKHGVNPQEKAEIKISVDLIDNWLNLYVYNKKVRVFQDQESSMGIGLQNIKTRLNLLYPNRHELRIMDNANDFSIDFRLNLA